MRVNCPCCSSALEVDASTGAILSWAQGNSSDDSEAPQSKWNEAIERVHNRTASSTDRFEASLLAEKSRPRDLNELIRNSSKNDASRGEPTNSIEP